MKTAKLIEPLKRSASPVTRLHVAANDNQAQPQNNKLSIKKQVREYEANLRYEHEDRLIAVMEGQERIEYRRNGLVPDHLQNLADEIESDIEAEVNMFWQELRDAS